MSTLQCVMEGISSQKNMGSSSIALLMPAGPGAKGASPFINDKRVRQEFAMVE